MTQFFNVKILGQVVFGSITIKNDGKVSYSIRDAKQYSPAQRYQAKAWAEKNILPELLKNSETTNTQSAGIIGQLYEKTTDLKIAYIAKTKEYAKRHFDHIVKLLTQPMELWYAEYKVSTKIDSNGDIAPASGEYGKRNLYKMRNQIKRLNNIVHKGFETFEAAEIKHAEQHYNDSVLKLNARLQKKGIVDGCQIEILTSSVGVNLELTIKHNNTITKAWTIVAEGEIQRPHYRYLVK